MGDLACADDEGRLHCDTCRFYRTKGSKCQRFPPVVIYDVANLQRVVLYPNVANGMWCGEHQPRTPS
jgi:hypothetical protein